MHPETDKPSSPPTRRSFFEWVTYGFCAVAGAVVALPFLGYVLLTRKREEKWKKLGKVSEYPQGETRMVDFDNPLSAPWDGITSRTGVFVRYLGKDADGDHDFLVLAANCAHLGCGVSWFPQSGLFMCPCHGGVYYANGKKASGPPPRGLFQCTWEMRGGDELWIQAPHYPSLQDRLSEKDTEEG